MTTVASENLFRSLPRKTQIKIDSAFDLRSSQQGQNQKKYLPEDLFPSLEALYVIAGKVAPFAKKIPVVDFYVTNRAILAVEVF